MLEEIPSKTRQKQAMHELQALGETLAALPAATLAGLALPDALAEAIGAARRIASHGARRRQLQYIGRLMRTIDAEPIRAQLAALEGRSAGAAARHKRLERWRERLIEDDAALTEFAAGHPRADLQAIRTAIRNAREEHKRNAPPRAFRELFRLLREADGNPA